MNKKPSTMLRPFVAVVSCSLVLGITAWLALSLAEYFRTETGNYLHILIGLASQTVTPRLVITALFMVLGGYLEWVIVRSRVGKDVFKPNNLYHALLNTTPEAVIIADPEGIIKFVSPRGLDLFTVNSHEAAAGRPVFDFIDRRDHKGAKDNFQRRLSSQALPAVEYRMVRGDGSGFVGELSATLISDRKKKPQAVIATVRDVTERKEANEELRYRLDFERVITSLSSRFIRLTPDEIDRNIVYAVQAVGEFTGADRCHVFRLAADQQTISNTHEWCADGIEPLMKHLQKLPARAFEYSLKLMREDKLFHVPRVAGLPNEAADEREEFERQGIQSRACVPLIQQGKISGFLGVDSVRRERSWSDDDITLLTIVGETLTTALEREQVERALRESEEKYRSFVQNFQGVAYRSRMDWIPLFFHGAVEQITGYTEKELISGSPRWDQMIHPEDWPRIKDSAHKIATVPNYSVEREYRIRHKDGCDKWIHEMAQNVCDDQGPPRLVQGAIYDITERKRMEKIQSALFKISEATNLSDNLQELLETIHAILGTLIDTTNFYVALYDEETDMYSFPYLVDEYEDGTDLKPEQLRKSLTDYVRKTGKPALIDNQLHHELEQRGEITLVGQPSPIWLGVPLKTPHGVIGVVTVQSYSDPTLYKESDMDLMTFVSGHIAMAIERKQAEMLIRHSEQEHRTLVETMRDGVMKVDTNEDIIFANPAACEILGYQSGELEGLNLRKIVIEQDMDKVVTGTRNRLKKHRSRYDLTVRRKDGELRQVSISAAPYLDDRGNVGGAVGVFTDITELKKAQEEGQRLREKLANAQRMESLGVLAGGVAHDLNNILGPLVGYPEVIKRRLPPDSSVRDQIAKIEESAKRAAEVVQDLLTMGRRGRYEMAHTDLNRIITSYLESPDFVRQRSRFPKVRTKVQLDPAVPPVYGSDAHLSKVLMNLVINALDAMPDGGTLTIKTECQHLTKLFGGYDNIEHGRYNILTVTDTGIGIDEADSKRIFDPFFSKKKLGKSGSGLGLSVVYAVVKDHNGYVDVRSELAKGSDFIIYLPALETGAATGEQKPVYDIKGNEKILVVDDVAEQRELAVTLLSSLGYQMTSVASGREAVAYLKDNDCDVVVLDMIMEPDFDGLDTYRELIQMHPGQKAVIVSGFSQTDRVREAEKLGVTKYVKKPYTMQSLGKAIREVLATSPSSTKGVQSKPSPVR
jgi:two-component system cell cycle sensor histidine kinase/response regulator CckA